MTLITLIILGVAVGVVALLALAPDIPARRNPFPGRRRRRTSAPRLNHIPHQ